MVSCAPAGNFLALNRDVLGFIPVAKGLARRLIYGWQDPSEPTVNQTLFSKSSAPTRYRRSGDRRPLRLPGRLTWRDSGGALRFVSVMTRDVSDVDVFVECQVPASIPLYRLVHLQIEKSARTSPDLPRVLQQGKVLSAVYRIGPCKPSTGTPEGYALRLLVEPTVRSAGRPAIAAIN